MAGYALVAAVALILGGARGYVVALYVDGAQPTRQVNWGGETFASKTQLARWLTAHGSRYRAWAKRHPVEAANLEGRPKR